MRSFPTRRGRPKQATSSTDPGTPELIMKRAHGVTAEPIDLCLERNIITEEQHWCGLHLRWLYTIRYGTPNISALNLMRGAGEDIAEDDPDWRAAREEELQDAVDLLASKRRYEPVAGLCIYNEPARFLNRELLCRAYNSQSIAHTIEREIDILRDGLDLLVHHWGRLCSSDRPRPERER